MYASGLGTEKQHMQDIGGLVEQHLVRCGFEVRRNKPEMTLTQAVSDSNAWGPDVHVAIHSNAGGGQGTECWHYTGSTKGQALALAVYNEVAQLTPAPDRGVKHTQDLYEVAKTSAPACILEVAFHDRPEEAAWIVAHKAELAEAITKGICKYFGVVWAPIPQPDPAPTKLTLKLRVGGREIRRSDGKVFLLDVPAKVEAGRTLVPLRAIAEALGCFVHYDAGTKEITITWEV
jgi:N-acetylmuramoyl-L-alanine amidase